MSDELIETRATYDVIAPEFAKVVATGYPGLHQDVARMREAVGPQAWVADIGCGPGRDSALLRESGLRVVSLDLSEGMLRAGDLRGKVQADMRALPLRGGSLDGIWCQAALLHIPRGYAPSVLAGFACVLRPGGRLHLSVAAGESQGWEVAENYASPQRRWFTYHTRPGIEALLTAAGFAVAEVREHEHHRSWLTIAAHTAI
ncbi:SAM-dependent methyltransferase [Allocatelliglobosispora scoriae]|uniref:SAM-dependent methyltransferase n=1 Tax=Allocatelliglobosispora scoriae TaxID=643052 RepID=A0A841BXQ6_9ACTN|nr:class I SAM-dependent methyltransferase [Allocatelliglobosispora scoriae]MBB5873937.1 SAM-dependent methyltransferase [Allocatelliglobosispora scoriae]